MAVFAITPILDTLNERIGLHLDLHVLHDERPERVMLSTQTEQPIRLAAVHPEVIEVLGDTFIGPGADPRHQRPLRSPERTDL